MCGSQIFNAPILSDRSSYSYNASQLTHNAPKPLDTHMYFAAHVCCTIGFDLLWLREIYGCCDLGLVDGLRIIYLKEGKNLQRFFFSGGACNFDEQERSIDRYILFIEMQAIMH